MSLQFFTHQFLWGTTTVSSHAISCRLYCFSFVHTSQGSKLVVSEQARVLLASELFSPLARALATTRQPILALLPAQESFCTLEISGLWGWIMYKINVNVGKRKLGQMLCKNTEELLITNGQQHANISQVAQTPRKSSYTQFSVTIMWFLYCTVSISR